MYKVLLAIQAVATAIMYLCTIRLTRARGSAGSKYLLLTAACADIYAIGYLIEMSADTYYGALNAVRFEYAGLSFMALCYYMFVSDYCKCKRLPKPVLLTLLALDVFVCFLVINCRHNRLYYALVTFDFEGLFPHLVTEKGIFYWYFLVQQVGLLTLCIFCFYRFWKSKRKAEDKKLYLTLVIESNLPIIGLAINMLFPEIDFGSLMICIMLSGMILTLTNGRLFDVKDVAFESLYENLGNGIIVVDSDLNFINANLMATEIFPQIRDFDASHMITELDPLLCKEQTEHYFDINHVYYSSTCRRLFERGRHVGYLISISDVTEMRERLNEMQQLKDAADSANEAKSAFLANMSHEIRTPLNAIIGMAELSEKESEPNVIQDYVSQIKSAGKMLLDIVTDVLDFSKAESGKLEIIPVKYDLEDLLNSIINVTNMRIGDKPIDFYVDIDPKIPKILYGDDVRIKQILINFLSNAEKYTADGKITFYVNYEKYEDGIMLKFAVEDTGKGIKKEDQDKLFKPFSQVDMRKNRKITGTGLGLSIAGQLINLMEGTYNVESVYGSGSTFSFAIPQKVIAATPLKSGVERSSQLVKRASTFGIYRGSAAVTDNKKAPEEEEVSFPNAKVLVVDDNRVNVKVLCAYLKHFGIEADSSLSGNDAILKCEKNHYDIIFMDHMMPEMDGVEATGYIRKNEESQNKDSIIIACTANVLKGVEEMFHSAGMNDFVAKPLQMDVLRKILTKYLEQ